MKNNGALVIGGGCTDSGACSAVHTDFMMGFCTAVGAFYDGFYTAVGAISLCSFALLVVYSFVFFCTAVGKF